MSGKKSKVTVEIMGEVCTLKGDIEVERIVRVAAMVDERMQKIARGNSRLSPTKVAVLMALNLADEYLRLEQDYLELIDLVKEEKE
ncbi:MAG TPA: cell division protein ZapA, partial [Patescibacteria group bacterium]|nr:cell division protein ZapA [Patescibacteria group bacterium]